MGPWDVTHQDGGTLRIIHPEGNWCPHPKSITIFFNRLRRCPGDAPSPQHFSYNLQQLEGDEDEKDLKLGSPTVRQLPPRP